MQPVPPPPHDSASSKVEALCGGTPFGEFSQDRSCCWAGNRPECPEQKKGDWTESKRGWGTALEAGPLLSTTHAALAIWVTLGKSLHPFLSLCVSSCQSIGLSTGIYRIPTMYSACAGCRGQISRTDTAPDLRKLPSDWEDGHGNKSNKNGNARTIMVSIDREKLREQKKPTSGDPDTGGSEKASRRRPSPER